MKRNEKLRWYEAEFESISNEVKESEFLSYLSFLRVRNFKLQNSSPESESRITRITKTAFSLAKEDKIKEAIECLIDLDGVRIPIASTILAVKYPDKFAIIDSRVIKKIGKVEWLSEYLKKPEVYEEYLLLLRKMAEEKKMRLRDLERMLFESE